jgi:hypothetical protein
MWIVNLLVLGAATVLFLLWFRYMCALLLAAQTSLDCTEAVARANSLAFVDVLREIGSDRGHSAEQLDALAAALERDFEVVAYLLRHMGESPLIEAPAEAWMLKVDFRIQRLWFQLLRRISTAGARGQVNQMAIIICHFADLIGERRIPAHI